LLRYFIGRRIDATLDAVVVCEFAAGGVRPGDRTANGAA
jgi:hypothetical protein